MYCANCGTQLSNNTAFCSACGDGITQASQSAPPSTGLLGFSPRISDPAYTKYIKNSNRWAGIFAAILAAAVIIGFYIYGETSRDMDNPQALYIGLGIGNMFLLIALFQIVGRKRSRTWDGYVIDKTVKSKTRRERYGHDEYRVRPYTEYTVIIREDSGRTHEISAEDDDTVYKYYRIGDRVRHHAGLNSYEKYDKSKDSIIFCNACGTLCDIADDTCSRCKCPLLK